MTHPTYRGRPPGEFATLHGWSLCWQAEELPSNGRDDGSRLRLTVSAVKSGAARCIFRDDVFPYQPTARQAEKSLASLEAMVRHLVEEIESLEAAWAIPAK